MRSEKNAFAFICQQDILSSTLCQIDQKRLGDVLDEMLEKQFALWRFIMQRNVPPSFTYLKGAALGFDFMSGHIEQEKAPIVVTEMDLGLYITDLEDNPNLREEFVGRIAAELPEFGKHLTEVGKMNPSVNIYAKGFADAAIPVASKIGARMYGIQHNLVEFSLVELISQRLGIFNY